MSKHNHIPPDYLAGLPSLPDHICTLVADYSNPFSTPEAEKHCSAMVLECAKAIRERNEAKGRLQCETRDANPPIEMRVRTNGATRINKSHERE